MSGPLTLRQDETGADLRAALDTVSEMDLRPFDPDAPNTFSGIGESLKSLLRPSAGAGRALLMAGAPVAIGIDEAREAGRAVGNAMDFLRRGGQPFGAMAMPEQAPITGAQDAYFRNVVDGLGSDAVEAWTPDPAAMGSVARTMSTINTVFGSIPQLVGMPGLFLASSGVDPAIDLARQGVDPGTAAGVGGLNLAANALGMKIPAAWGSTLATRLASGTGSNLAIGAATDAASAGTLRAAGYDEQAGGFEALNAHARGLDALMGAMFGVRAHFDAPRPTATQRDAFLTAANADSLRRTSMPGVPTMRGADVRHQDAMDAAIRSLLNGERVEVSSILRPGDFMLRQELRSTSPASTGLRGGNVAADVQADYETLGTRHGFRTSSTTRTKAENARVGGVENSQHLDHRGTARDWSVKGKSQVEIDAFVADLKAAGFEVITKPHGTGPHIHAELPPGGRQAVVARVPQRHTPDDVTPQRAVDAPARLEADAAPALRPTVEALRSGVEAFPAPPPRATVDEFAAWLTGRRVRQDAQERESLQSIIDGRTLANLAQTDAARDRLTRMPAEALGSDFAADSDVVRMAHGLWAQRANGSVIRLDEEGATVTVPAMKGGGLVRRSATVVDGELVAQVGMRYEALRDSGFGYYEAHAKRFGTPQEAAQAARAGRPAPQAVAMEPGVGIAAAVRAMAANAERSRSSSTVAQITADARLPASMQVARSILQAQPELRIPTGEVDADGIPATVTAGELLARAEQDLHAARLDGDALTAAATCFMRFGQ